MRRKYTDGVGYFINDDRPSGGTLVEDDALGCAHCQKILKKRIWLNNGGYCSQCDQEICTDCADRMIHGSSLDQVGCANFKAFVYRQLEEQYRREQNSRILGI